jgi:hypothetical protein
MKPVRYINQDLDYIYIRAEDNKGKWKSISLREANTLQFRKWLFEKFNISVERIDDDNLEITKKLDLKNPAMHDEIVPRDRVVILNWLNDQDAVIYMIKREARNNT